MSVDRLKAALERLMFQVMKRVDYLALYRCKVNLQNADLTLELTPEDSRLPSLSKVPIRVGIPGVQVRLKPGETILLGFENGDPRRPYATMFANAQTGLLDLVIFAENSVTISCDAGEIEVYADGAVNIGSATGVTLNSGVQDVARVGDTVQVTGTAGPYPIVATATITTGNPSVKA